MKYLPLFLAFVLTTSISFAQRKPNDQYVPVKFKEIQYPLQAFPGDLKTFKVVIENAHSSVVSAPKRDALLIANDQLKMDEENPDITLKINIPKGGLNIQKELKKRKKTRQGKVVGTAYYVEASYTFIVNYEFHNNRTNQTLLKGKTFDSAKEEIRESGTSKGAWKNYKTAGMKGPIRQWRGKALRSTFKQITNDFNSNFRKIEVERSLGVGKVKGKGDRLPDVQNAYDLTNEAIDALNEKKTETSTTKLKEAIKIWKKALTESNVKKRKARVNDRITRMLHYNLALGHYLLHDLTNCRKFAAESKKIRGIRHRAYALEKLADDKEKRYKINQVQFN
ncbi:MAG TPA: hypothetical protein DCS93_38230 [Microscillaceae bacterium]|nr:hypothetical protein [Microscillaceae bacterium]